MSNYCGECGEYFCYCGSKAIESIKHIREYMDIMKNEPEGYIKMSEVYHNIMRMLP